MTLPELTYDLLETIRNAKIVDDERISHRLLRHWIHNQRALWIRNEYNKHFRDIDDNVLQDYTAELSLVDSSLDSSLPTNQVYLRTTEQLPPLVELHNGFALLEVRGVDLKQIELNHRHWNELAFAGEGRWTANMIYSAIRDHYYYLKYGKNHLNPNNLKKIIIRGIFQTPPEVPGYVISTSNYPLNRFMYNYMKAEILKLDINTVLKTQADEVNDSTGELRN